jgi:hypothetical protein
VRLRPFYTVPLKQLNDEDFALTKEMKDLGQQICAAVKSGSLVEPFDAVMLRAACPGWTDSAYHIFLCDHAVGVGNPTEVVERISFGLYRLHRQPDTEPDDQGGSDLTDQTASSQLAE